MLEQLFGSKTRVLLLRLFLHNPEKTFYVREITRNLDTHLNSVRRELNNLEKIGIIHSFDKADLEKEAGKKLKDNKKYYKLNGNFVFIEELRSLIVKAQLILQKSMVKKVESLGNISFFLLSGVFVGNENSPVDLLVAGAVNRPKFNRWISSFEKELGKSINYTILTKADFIYRKDVNDRFLFELLEERNLIVIDKISKEQNTSATKK